MEKLDWIEDHAKANAAFQIGCAGAMERQASALLNLLLAGAGGALAYAVNLVEKGAPPWLQAGMTATALWLFAVAGAVLLGVLWSRPIYGPGNDPRNLLLAKEIDTGEARYFELENRQTCIDANRARNDSVGRQLNRCRAAAAVTPLAFAIGATAAWVC